MLVHFIGTKAETAEVSACMHTYVDFKTDADYDGEKSVFLFLHLIV